MDVFEQYLKKIDESSFDSRDAHKINEGFQQICKQLFEEGKEGVAIIADLDRQVYSVQKSFDKKLDIEKGVINGLSWQMSGTQTLEDGTVVPLHWPDVTKYTQKDIEYFEKRYKECKNLYAKTEYGLMVYFGEKTEFSKHNDFKKLLYQELLQLSKDYFTKANKGGERNFYVMDFFHTLRMAFCIVEKAKLQKELKEISIYIFETHQNWDITKEGTLRILLDMSGLMSEYFSLFDKQIDFQKVLDKNIEGAKELEKTYVWGAMYALDCSIAIEQKRKKDPSALLNYKAQLYEKLCAEAENKNNLACVNFAENALRLYEQLKDSSNISRLEKVYTDLRGKFSLSKIHQEFPKDETDRMNEKILKAIKENNENGIIYHFISTPWYDTISNISNQSEELAKQTVLLSMFPTTIMDKYGNTVDVFHTDEEKKEYNFWSTYTFNYQLGTQTMHRFFIEAYKSGKLNYKSVSEHFENSWFSEPIQRKYHGQIAQIKPIDTLKPGIKRIFDELDKYFANNEYQCDFVTIIDSLTLKVEGLLRFFCEKIGIATFKTRKKGADKLVMEKLLDDLLADLAHKPILKPDQETNFEEEDRIFIKYVMSEKAGLNLRNAVAHSLMDFNEYSFEQVVVLFCIIMRLSKYKFIETKGEK
ncbi:MAG: DUF4209 domain-containing protein [Bacteroidia bacterium]